MVEALLKAGLINKEQLKKENKDGHEETSKGYTRAASKEVQRARGKAETRGPRTPQGDAESE